MTVHGEGGSITALPILQDHGDIPSLGFRFGALAYSCDVSGLPAASFSALAGLDLWIVDALRYRPHPSHFSVDEALAWIERVKPRRAILTNLHSDLDYEDLRRKLPPHVEPAFDGLKLEMACRPLRVDRRHRRRLIRIRNIMEYLSILWRVSGILSVAGQIYCTHRNR